MPSYCGVVNAVAKENAPVGEADAAVIEFCDRRRAQFIEAMDDDLNTADGIAALFELAKDCNRMIAAGQATAGSIEVALKAFNELADVLGLLYAREEQGDDSEIEAMIEARAKARAEKNWAESDRIRDELKAMGIVVEDTPQGMKWHRA